MENFVAKFCSNSWRFAFWLCMLAMLAFTVLACDNSNHGGGTHDPDITKEQDAQIDGNDAADRVAASSFISDIAVADQQSYVAWLDSRDGDRNVYFNVKTKTGEWLHTSDLRLNPLQIGAELQSVKISVSHDGKYVHVVWADAQAGRECVYYSGSKDFGATFAVAKPLSPGWPFPFMGSLPNVCCSKNGLRVFVAWRHGHHDLAMRYSVDAGESWSSTTDPTTFYVNSDEVGKYLVHFPSMDCSDDGTYCYVAWVDYRTDFYIFHRAWDMGEQKWREEKQVSETRAVLPFVRCTGDGKTVHVVWTDISGSGGLYHDVSTDFGDTWGVDEAISEAPTNNDDYGTFTCNRYTGDICAVWNRDTTLAGDWTVMARARIKGVWQPQVEISVVSHRENKNSHDIPRICGVGNQIFALWTDYRDAPQERVYYNFSMDGGKTWAGYGLPLNTPGAEKSFRITNPSVDCDDTGLVYGIWAEARNSSIPQIHGRSLQIGGTSSDEKIPRSSLVPSHAWQGSICINQSNLYGVWLTDRHGFQDVYFSRSANDGFAWLNDFIVNVAQGEIARMPQITCDTKDNVYVIWEYPDYKAVENILETYVYFQRYSYGKSNSTGTLEGIARHSVRFPIPSKFAQLTRTQASKPNHGFRSQQISDDTYSGGNPILAADNQGHVYVAYQLKELWNVNPNFFVASDDRGVSWQGDFVTPDSNYDYLHYDCAFSDDSVYLVAEIRQGEDSRIIFYRNGAYGAPGSWDIDRRLDQSDNALSHLPKIFASGSNCFVIWQEYQSSQLAQVYYAYSLDNGDTWSIPQPFDAAVPTQVMAAEIATSAAQNNTVYGAWTYYQPKDRKFRIYFGKIQLVGTNVVATASIPLSDGSAEARNPTIACDNQHVYVAWQENTAGKFDIVGCHSLDGGKTWSNIYRWSTGTPGVAHAIQPQLQISKSWVHCVWKDYRYGLNVFYEQHQR